MAIKKIISLLIFMVGISNLSGMVGAEKSVDAVIELGAGEAAYVGGEYHFNALPLIPVENLGILCGYTFLSEDSVHVVEPTLFVSGSVFKYGSWRVKAGKLLVTSYEYNASGQAWTVSLDLLWKFTPWAYLELSFPYIMGEQGNAWSPCVGLGIDCPLWKGEKP
jgi:hypothetical protein